MPSDKFTAGEMPADDSALVLRRKAGILSASYDISIDQ